MVGIIMPCTVCKEKTQMDPFSKYNFGVCCERCRNALELRYNNLSEKYTKKMYLDMVKKGLGVD